MNTEQLDIAEMACELLRNKVKLLEVEKEIWKELSGWQDKLLSAYRMQTQPSGRCLDRIFTLKKVLKEKEKE